MKTTLLVVSLAVLPLLPGCANRGPRVVTTVKLKYPARPGDEPIRVFWGTEPRCPHMEIGAVSAWAPGEDMPRERIIAAMWQEARKMGGEALVGVTEEKRLVFGDLFVEMAPAALGRAPSAGSVLTIPLAETGRRDARAYERQVLTGSVVRFTDPHCVEDQEVTPRDGSSPHSSSQRLRLFVADETDLSGNDYSGQLGEFRVRSLASRIALMLREPLIVRTRPAVSGQFIDRKENPFVSIADSCDADIIVTLEVRRFEYGKAFVSGGGKWSVLQVNCQARNAQTGAAILDFAVFETSSEDQFARQALTELLSKGVDSIVDELLKRTPR